MDDNTNQTYVTLSLFTFYLYNFMLPVKFMASLVYCEFTSLIFTNTFECISLVAKYRLIIKKAYTNEFSCLQIGENLGIF